MSLARPLIVQLVSPCLACFALSHLQSFVSVFVFLSRNFKPYLRALKGGKKCENKISAIDKVLRMLVGNEVIKNLYPVPILTAAHSRLGLSAVPAAHGTPNCKLFMRAKREEWGAPKRPLISWLHSWLSSPLQWHCAVCRRSKTKKESGC